MYFCTVCFMRISHNPEKWLVKSGRDTDSEQDANKQNFADDPDLGGESVNQKYQSSDIIFSRKTPILRCLNVFIKNNNVEISTTVESSICTLNIF